MGIKIKFVTLRKWCVSKRKMTVKTLDTFEVYQLSLKIGEEVWNIVAKWDFFAKDTVGKQLVRSADSIAANVAEGQGRYFYKDRRIYCFYSRGSAFETLTWLEKGKQRNLLDEAKFQQLSAMIEEFKAKLNGYISTLNQQITTPK